MNEINENPSQTEERYISKIEVAQRMDVSTRTIESWMRQSKIPFEKIGRTVRFHWGDVRNYLSQRRAVVAQQNEPQLHPSSGDRLHDLANSIRKKYRLK